jgi:hypothetical protein
MWFMQPMKARFAALGKGWWYHSREAWTTAGLLIKKELRIKENRQ